MKIEKGVMRRKELPVETLDLGERRVQFTISREVVDRDGDILRASGVDLTNYYKNMVFLSFHNTRDFPLGKTEKVWVEGDRVKAIVYFPTLDELSSKPEYASEKARLVDFTYFCYKTKMLNAVSVGFIPLEWTETKTGYDITKWELLEFSAVAVPANQDAIAEAVKSFGLDESVVKDFFTTQKSGKRISAETKEVLNKIKACGDEIEKCRDQLKNIAKNMNELLAELDEAEEVISGDGNNGDKPDDNEPEEPEEPQDDDKSFELPDVPMIELPDVE